jgi:multidrug efflux pump
MDISRFFIDRPIFAAVLSIMIFMAGLVCLPLLPVSEYPQVTPPSVVVRAQYPGANPKVIAQTVATPLEEQINGVENMLYMSSQSTADGQLALTVTFKLGTDPDWAQQLVQNRVAQALPRLPDIVRQFGVMTAKSSPNLTMVVHITSPDGRYNTDYLRNYANLNIKNNLARLKGIGEVMLFGGGDYAMRIWLDPNKISALGLTATDVTNAVREQNMQVAAGVIGAQPNDNPGAFELLINAQGRLQTEEQFGDIIVKTSPTGGIIRLKDVARIELGSNQYAMRSLLDNKQASAIAVFQAPGSNAIQLSNDVRNAMEEMKKTFPESVDYTIVYDPTRFVQASIDSVIKTLLEAVLLVVLVVIVFLQTWRASIIPLLAVPVSVVGTFAVMHLFGFSINNLTLFGLVLSIGIVVDDAIVVVENVERNIEEGLSPRDATYKAMQEVSGPIIAIALTLCAVFVPLAFISGLTGQFYRQFALTIAISTVISAFNSLTLSPALAAKLLKSDHSNPDWLTRVMDNSLGWFFRGFNRFFKKSSDRYAGGVGRVTRHKFIMMMFYAVLIAASGLLFKIVPTGYVPTQDKQYLVAFAQLPSGASLERSDAVIRRMSDIALATPGVQSAVAFPGLSINGFAASSSAGIIFFTLKPFEERTSDELYGPAIAEQLSAKMGQIEDAFIGVFPPPPVDGLGMIGGFRLQVEDRADLGDEALYQAMMAVQMKAWQTPELTGVFSSYQINVPQLFADLDRDKAKQLGVPVTSVFETMQVYLGSLYINDFNKFGRTYQVIAQADAPFRDTADDIGQLKVRNMTGEMIPLGSMLTVSQSYGPDSASRYNLYRTAELNGGPALGYSSGEAEAAMIKILKETLPQGMDFEWTELKYQEILAGNTALYIFPLCVLLVFLVLAAQYESLSLPLAIIMIVPVVLLCGIFGVWVTGGDNNIFTQIGLIVLVGLACKNAILIVEFARELEMQGMKVIDAAIMASRLRLRPILMTSFAFIMGVLPLVMSTGAGAEMRHAIGIAVFSGMLGVTFLGLFLTPVFYVLLRTIAGGKLESHHPTVTINCTSKQEH